MDYGSAPGLRSRGSRTRPYRASRRRPAGPRRNRLFSNVDEASPPSEERWRSVIRDRDQLVRIGALVAAPADGGGDRVNRRGPVAIHDARDIAEAVGGRRPRKIRPAGSGIVSRGITRHVVRYAEVQAVRQSVGELPLAGARVKDSTSGGQLWGFARAWRGCRNQRRLSPHCRCLHRRRKEWWHLQTRCRRGSL